jgi:hypothetical protein
MGETEISRILVPGHPGQNVPKCNLRGKKVGVVAHTCHPCNCGKLQIGQPGQKAEPISKITREKRA